MSSPKDFLMSTLKQHGVSLENAEEIWLQFEGYCARLSAIDFPDSEFPALVFNGEGGDVVGVDRQEAWSDED